MSESLQPRVKTAIHWGNGMVMVFGEEGQQILELQGRYSEVREKVLAASDAQTTFEIGVWNKGLQTVPREDW